MVHVDDNEEEDEEEGEEGMENLEDGNLKTGVEVNKFYLRNDSETDSASSSLDNDDGERSVELGEERTAAFEEEMELEVKGEEEKRCIKKRGKRGEYKKRKFIDLSYYGRKTRIRQRLQDVDKDELKAMYKSLQRKEENKKANIPPRMSVLYLTKTAGISQRKLDIV